MDCGPPGSSVRGISRQEHWSELPFPSPGDLANSGIEPTSPVLPAESSQCEPPGKPKEDCKKQFMVVAPTRQSLLIWPMSPQGQKSWIFCLAEFLMAPGSLLAFRLCNHICSYNTINEHMYLRFANASKRFFFFLQANYLFFKKSPCPLIFLRWQSTLTI